MEKLIIYNKNSTEGLAEIEDCSIDLIITSPPYFNLIDYGVKDQLGYDDTYPEYLNKLHAILDSFIRVLKNDRFIAINIGDVVYKKSYGKNDVNLLIPIQSDIIQYFTNQGITLFRHIKWFKPDTSYHARGAQYQGYFFPRRVAPQFNSEHILVFYKNFSTVVAKTECKKRYESFNYDGIPSEMMNDYSSEVWDIPTISKIEKIQHPACFPEEIPYRLIKLFSFENELILDPFMGRGTTLKMALATNRNCIGYELNQEYINYFLNEYLDTPIKCNDYYLSKLYDLLKKQPSILSGLSVQTIGEKTVIK